MSFPLHCGLAGRIARAFGNRRASPIWFRFRFPMTIDRRLTGDSGTERHRPQCGGLNSSWAFRGGKEVGEAAMRGRFFGARFRVEPHRRLFPTRRPTSSERASGEPEECRRKARKAQAALIEEFDSEIRKASLAKARERAGHTLGETSVRKRSG